MKAKLEKIDPLFGSSFTMRNFHGIRSNTPEWHFHPEYEIVYVSNGRGKRHIANHISYFEDGDLILLGPHLPHFGFTEKIEEEHEEIVLQMKPDFLGQTFMALPEISGIRQLFERAHVGISFYGKTKTNVGTQMKQMLRLQGFERLMALLQLLQQLATSREYKLLNIERFSLEVDSQHFDRMQEIYEYVGKHYQKEISLQEIARRVNMTPPAFCRFFKKLTKKTFTQFTNEMRVAQACRLLANEHLSIASVSYESGFNNLSHFNKQFRLITGLSPSEYRKQQHLLVSAAQDGPGQNFNPPNSGF